jgi:hypothetical protein
MMFSFGARSGLFSPPTTQSLFILPPKEWSARNWMAAGLALFGRLLHKSPQWELRRS